MNFKAYILGVKNVGNKYFFSSNPYIINIVWFSNRYQSPILVSGLNCNVVFNFEEILGGTKLNRIEYALAIILFIKLNISLLLLSFTIT